MAHNLNMLESFICPPLLHVLQIPEIITFMFLLIIFILAYGVASHALIDPYRMLNMSEIAPLLLDIVFLPYWQMYGELSLDRFKKSGTTQQSISKLKDVCFIRMEVRQRDEDCAVANKSAELSSICSQPDQPHLTNFNYITQV